MGDKMHNPWLEGSHIKDEGNLQSIAEYFAKQKGLTPDQTPTIMLGDRMGSNGLPDLGFTTTRQVMHEAYPHNEAPFVPQKSETGFSLIKPGMSEADTISSIRHEAEHNFYNHNQQKPFFQSPYVDYTHGPQGADAFGVDWSYDAQNPAWSKWLSR